MTVRVVALLKYQEHVVMPQFLRMLAAVSTAAATVAAADRVADWVAALAVGVVTRTPVAAMPASEPTRSLSR
ncbi:hypothetical protein ABGB18_25600 [Nonomuraea sp. B12E4]|uniref:hypothetical protein n=1 Tax=Nonomuraea sp. B12E4 TaxID=3153564 RepID=UPI00325EB4B9